MQPHRPGNAPAIQLLENVRTRLLMRVIDAVLSQVHVIANQKVAQIVEQRGDHQRIAEIALDGEVRRLQRMLLLIDR